jgi:hypothetical protein
MFMGKEMYVLWPRLSRSKLDGISKELLFILLFMLFKRGLINMGVFLYNIGGEVMFKGFVGE